MWHNLARQSLRLEGIGLPITKARKFENTKLSFGQQDYTATQETLIFRDFVHSCFRGPKRSDTEFEMFTNNEETIRTVLQRKIPNMTAAKWREYVSSMYGENGEWLGEQA